jgi:predicted MFS family arabinose efflux permease
VQAFGTASAYPAGLAIFRARDRRGQAPAAALGAVTMASSVSAALGPVLGGGLVALGGWPAIFLANVPVVIVGLVLAWRWLPPDPAPRAAGEAARSGWAAVRALDLPGVVLFSGLLVSLLGFLLSLAGRPLWLLLPLAVLAAVLLLLREWHVSTPFLDVRLLAANRRLVGVYAQFAAVNLVFYAIFFGLPLWLEEARQYTPDTTGLLLLPVAGVGVLATPLAARLVDRSGPRPSLIVGSVLLLAGMLLLLLFDASTPLPVLLAVGAILGVPNGFNNLGLQAALYEAAPAQQMGAAGGLFQTFRYAGAILSTAIIGLVFGASATSGSLHVLAVILAVVSVLLVMASILTERSSPGRAQA